MNLTKISIDPEDGRFLVESIEVMMKHPGYLVLDEERRDYNGMPNNVIYDYHKTRLSEAMRSIKYSVQSNSIEINTIPDLLGRMQEMQRRLIVFFRKDIGILSRRHLKTTDNLDPHIKDHHLPNDIEVLAEDVKAVNQTLRKFAENQGTGSIEVVASARTDLFVQLNPWVQKLRKILDFETILQNS